MLGPAQSDALGAKLHRLSGIPGGVGIGADLKLPGLIGPRHEPAEVPGDGRLYRINGLPVNVAGGSVDGNPITLVIGASGQGKRLVLFVHRNLPAAGDTAGAHAPGYHSGVAGHTAAHREDTLGSGHALNVLRAGLQADQDHLFAPGCPRLGIVGSEHHPAAGGAGRGRQALAHHMGGLQGLGVKLRVQQRVELLGLYPHDRFPFVDHPFIHQIHRNLQGRSRRTLAVSGLEHIELPILNGELHILHIPVMIFQAACDRGKLLVNLRHILLQLVDLGGRADAGYHVFALGVDEIFAEELLLSRGGVPGKRHAGAGVLVQVAEYHGHHIDGGSPGIGNVVHAAIVVGAGVVPGAEHGLDGLHHLDLGIGGELLALLLPVERLKPGDQLLHIVLVQIDVIPDALSRL